MAVNKSGWNTNIKVSQKTIDEIKKMGMAKALKTVAGASKASGQDASAKAWVEGVKRLYGANRVADAVKSSAPAPKKSGPMSANTTAKRTTTGPKSANTPAVSKKQSTTSNPVTAAFNKLSPYGNKNQKYKSPFSDTGLAGKSPAAVKAEMERRRAAANTPKKKTPAKPKAKVTSFTPTRQF